MSIVGPAEELTRTLPSMESQLATVVASAAEAMVAVGSSQPTAATPVAGQSNAKKGNPRWLLGCIGKHTRHQAQGRDGGEKLLADHFG